MCFKTFVCNERIPFSADFSFDKRGILHSYASNKKISSFFFPFPQGKCGTKHQSNELWRIVEQFSSHCRIVLLHKHTLRKGRVLLYSTISMLNSPLSSSLICIYLL
eukprot:TRINITY_DN7640_c2_g1_i3.p1 TRINITY_DN7640_c2_g1~~TRINITY_DN7640_c2_g1_i3.p1  ORF type:complete len:106 (-),score=5.12 TRINITY_DN7640_c2_g1_i3:419-736(-)